MRSRAPWPQMAAATVVVTVLPAVVVGGLSAAGVLSSIWACFLAAVVLSLAFSSAASAVWRRHASGDVLFSDLLLWGWLRRRRTERRLARADELLWEAGHVESARKDDLLHELGAALDAQDPYLDGHSRRVARYVTMIAQRMHLPDEQLERAKAAATIHDVGKLRIPEEVVHKPGRLTDTEFEVMKQHAAAGGAMVECLGDPALAAAVRAHHERWDGSGYPDGLAWERIPVEARIISVADTFDAITSARPYRAAKPHAKALQVIEEEAGRQLDPDAAHAFISCYSDRRGAALWAGLASIPRQVASRLSTSPAELTGVLATALTAPLVVVAGAAAAAAMPAADPQAAEQQAQVVSGVVATPQPYRPSSATPTVTPSPTARAGIVVTVTVTATATATATATSAPLAGAVAGAIAQPSPSGTASATPAAGSTPVGTLPAAKRPAATPGPPAREAVPPAPGTVSPEAPPVATDEPTVTPEPTAKPEPTATIEPEPTPEPLPPLFPTNLPIFPTPTPPPTPTPTPPPHTADDCKHGGWIDLGYPNQGQCIADADRP